MHVQLVEHEQRDRTGAEDRHCEGTAPAASETERSRDRAQQREPDSDEAEGPEELRPDVTWEASLAVTTEPVSHAGGSDVIVGSFPKTIAQPL
jgi:hypothetical protein